MALPNEFWNPNEFGVCGGVECGLMSSTLDRDVAMGYASGDKAKTGIVIECQQGERISSPTPLFCPLVLLATLTIRLPLLRAAGMVARGADISWLSQYPHEKEILFGPLTGIEVLNKRIDVSLVVIECAFSVNLSALTLEQVRLFPTHLTPAASQRPML